MKSRAILHADINNFYASVAMLEHPDLKNVPLAVTGNPEKRHGIILAKNALAKACGVKTGEAIWVSKQKCQDLVTIMPDYKKYTDFSKKIFDIYTEFTSEVESFGLDECWLDVTGSWRLFGDQIQMAFKIKDEVKKRTGLTISIGVSFTKTFSKLGSDLKKPDAVSIIGTDNFKEVAWRLPVQEMLNVGRSTEEKLLARNIKTIGELANTDKNVLVKLFGKFGESLHLAANGEDSDPVKSYTVHRIPESIGNGMTSSHDIETLIDAEALVYSLVEVVAARLRELHMIAMGVAVSVRDNSLKTFSRQRHLFCPTANARVIAEEAMLLLKENYNFDTMLPIRTITVTVVRLLSNTDKVQSMLFEGSGKGEKLEMHVDSLRKKYGFDILKRGVIVDSAFQCDARELEDDFVSFGKGKGGLLE